MPRSGDNLVAMMGQSLGNPYPPDRGFWSQPSPEARFRPLEGTQAFARHPLGVRPCPTSRG